MVFYGVCSFVQRSRCPIEPHQSGACLPKEKKAPGRGGEGVGGAGGLRHDVPLMIVVSPACTWGIYSGSELVPAGVLAESERPANTDEPVAAKYFIAGILNFIEELFEQVRRVTGVLFFLRPFHLHGRCEIHANMKPLFDENRRFEFFV